MLGTTKTMWTLALAVGASVTVACSDDLPTARTRSQVTVPELVPVPPQAGKAHVMMERDHSLSMGMDHPLAGPPVDASPILYHNGPTITNIKVKVIYWSNRTIYQGGPAPNTIGDENWGLWNDVSLVAFFLQHLGGSPYYNINTTYYNANPGVHVANTVDYTGFWATTASAPAAGTAVDEGIVESLVATALHGQYLSWDPNAVYVVLTDSAVTSSDHPNACGYHNNFTGFEQQWNGQHVHYALVLHAGYRGGCNDAYPPPNNDQGADVVVSVLVHEIEETSTDWDYFRGWADHNDNENADKCRLTFEPNYPAPENPSALADANIGGKHFMIQGNWVNDAQGGVQCATELYTVDGPSYITTAGTTTWAVPTLPSGSTLDWQMNDGTGWQEAGSGNTLSLSRNSGDPPFQASLRVVATVTDLHLDSPRSVQTPDFAFTWIPPGQPLSVDLTGPTLMGPSDACWWFATAHDGTPPYTYTWQNGAFVETTSGTSAMSSTGPVHITVSVTDAASGETGASMDAQVDEGVTGCQ